jgi:hypothetical protein
MPLARCYVHSQLGLRAPHKARIKRVQMRLYDVIQRSNRRFGLGGRVTLAGIYVYKSTYHESL